MAKLMLSNVRCAFLVLGDPEDYQGNKQFRWSATGLLPYDSPALAAARETMKAAAVDIAQIIRQSLHSNLRLTQPGEYVQQVVALAGWTTRSARLEGARGLHVDRSNRRCLVRTLTRRLYSLGWDAGTLGTFGCGRLGSDCLRPGFYSQRRR